MSLTLENFFLLLYKALVISKGPPAKAGALGLFVLPALTPEHSLHIQCTLQVHHAHSAPSHIPLILFFTFLAVWFCCHGNMGFCVPLDGFQRRVVPYDFLNLFAVDIMIGDTKEDVDIAWTWGYKDTGNFKMSRVFQGATS
ncbi:hypothetical protein AU210_014256 [Fusarium oxysporum f. sp. radicis-cucumerinum]|uniref:Uncharacterized protein n=1 Tax=Fusarium oxysporum f. sp. radicis-cucumerinum TaxID=327505 RepID=A0A2H3G2G4_FUSOX|nr:hypothetical protein AU210_014256 [Fusarium oxysporum f. sp. radicis-cucumerinum]